MGLGEIFRAGERSEVWQFWWGLTHESRLGDEASVGKGITKTHAGFLRLWLILILSLHSISSVV